MLALEVKRTVQGVGHLGVGEHRASVAGGLPIGVSAFRSRYRSSLGVHGVLKHLGTYDTPSEARAAYVVAKEHYVKLLAEDYKQVLHPDVYTHLINWRARWQVLT